jgi:hypothetical protein
MVRKYPEILTSSKFERVIIIEAAEDFWGEARRVEDRFHVSGLPVLTILFEILPGDAGRVFDYRAWYEAPTRLAVSLAAVGLQ